ISVVPVHEAGADPVTELSYALGASVAYFRRLHDLGLTPRAIADQLSFAFSVGSDFFMEVAKLRAMRLLIVKVFAALYLSQDAACLVPIHVRTSSWNKTQLEPWLDLSKTTVEVLAAIVGGASGVVQVAIAHEQLDVELRERLTRNIAWILREEAH